MENVLASEVLFAIQKDSVLLFDKIEGEGKFGLRFGRFPLLSAMYLVGAKRIIKKYFNRLIAVKNFNDAGAAPVLDCAFRAKCGKSLRYCGAGAVVHPAEMLAALRKYRTLKKVYPKFAAAGFAAGKVPQIVYSDTGVMPQTDGERIKLPRRRLTRLQKRKIGTVCAVCCTSLIALGAVIIGLAFGVGFGTKAVPYVIRSQEALKGKSGYAKLAADVEISYCFEDVKLNIDGNGHTVILQTPFAKRVSGSVKNLKVRYNGAAHPVAEVNDGKISGVTVLTGSVTVQKQSEHQGLIACINNGRVEQCTVKGDVTVEGTAENDCYFGMAVGKNCGIIAGTVTEGSVQASFADLGGIAGYNAESGSITNCENRSNLTSVCTSDAWNPNAGGITVGNDGTVTACKNSGTVSITLVNTASDKTLYAQAAGIAVSSTGSVAECENSAGISVQSTDGYACAAGVCCANTYRTVDETVEYGGYTYVQPKNICGSVANSTSKADVQAICNLNAFASGVVADNGAGCLVDGCTAEGHVQGSGATAENVFSYFAGIVAFNSGGVKGCVADVSLNAQGNALVGAVTASTKLYQDLFYGYYLDMLGNSYFANEGADCGNGSVFYTDSVTGRQIVVSADYLAGGALSNLVDYECERLTAAK